MRLVWNWQALYLIVLSGGVAIVYIGGLAIDGLLLGVAVAQWAAYGLAVLAFARRGHLDARLMGVSFLIHGFVALTAFACSAACARLLQNTAIGVQVLGELLVALTFIGALFLGRFRFPATRVLADRLTQAVPDKQSRLGFTWPV